MNSIYFLTVRQVVIPQNSDMLIPARKSQAGMHFLLPQPNRLENYLKIPASEAVNTIPNKSFFILTKNI